MEGGDKETELDKESKLLIERVQVRNNPGENLPSEAAGGADSSVDSFWDYISMVTSPECAGADDGNKDDEKNHGTTITIVARAGATTQVTKPTATVTKADDDGDGSKAVVSVPDKKKQQSKSSDGISSQRQKQKNWAKQHHSFPPPIHVPILHEREELQFGPVPRPSDQQQVDSTRVEYSAVRNFYPQECYDRPLDFLPVPRDPGLGSSSSSVRPMLSGDSTLPTTYNLFSASSYRNPYDVAGMASLSRSVRTTAEATPTATSAITSATGGYNSGVNSESLSSSSSSAFQPYKPNNDPFRHSDPFPFLEHGRFLRTHSFSGASTQDTEPMERMLSWQEFMSMSPPRHYGPLPSAPPFTPPVTSPPQSPSQYAFGQTFYDLYRSPVHSPPPPLPARPIPYRPPEVPYFPNPWTMLPAQYPQYESSLSGRTSRQEHRPVPPAIVISSPPPGRRTSVTETATTPTTTNTMSFSSATKQATSKVAHQYTKQQGYSSSSSTNRTTRKSSQYTNRNTVTTSASYETLGGPRRQYLKPFFVPLANPPERKPVAATTTVKNVTTATATTTTVRTGTPASSSRRKIRGDSMPKKVNTLGHESKSYLDYYPEYCGYGTPPPQSYRPSCIRSSSSSSSSMGHYEFDMDAEIEEDEEDTEVEGAASLERQQDRKQRRKGKK